MTGHISRRTLLQGTLGMAALGGLSACGGNDSGASSTGGAKAGTGSKSFQFYQSGDANQGGGYAKMIAAYEQATGVKVELVEIPNADLPTKIKNAAQANDLPAMARVGAIDPVWRDAVVDLKDIATASKAKTDLSAVTPDGKVLSLPSDITAVGLYLNTTLWDKAGVKYPTSESAIWTWDEFVAAAKQVQAKAGAKYGLVFDRSSHRLNSFLYEFGSELWAPDASGAYKTNDATKTALEYFKKLNDDKFMPKSVWLSADDPNALFKSGQVAAYYSGSWQIADFAKNIKDFQWKSVYAPKQPVRAVNYGNAASVVVFDGPAKQAALDFVKWLYTPENYKKLCEYSGMLPAVEGVTPSYTSNQEAFALYNAEIAASPKIVAQRKSDGLKMEVAGKATEGDPTREETIKFLNGQQDVDATIANISAALTKAFK